MVPWVGLKCVIVVFPDHTHLLFNVRQVPREMFKTKAKAFLHLPRDLANFSELKTMLDRYYCTNSTFYSPFTKGNALYFVVFSQSTGGWTFLVVCVPVPSHKKEL